VHADAAGTAGEDDVEDAGDDAPPLAHPDVARRSALARATQMKEMLMGER
jgi:hypothetical protein